MRPAAPDNRARSGVAPVLLVDVQTSAGECFYWSDRRVAGIAPVIAPFSAAVSFPLAAAKWDGASGTAKLLFGASTGLMDGLSVTPAGLTLLAFLNGVTGSVAFLDSTSRIAVFTPAQAVSNADVAIAAETGGATLVPVPAAVTYAPWLLGAGELAFNRSLVTDTGSLTLQNVSGDVLQTDWERVARRSTLEGALCVVRYFDLAAEFALIEQHGTLTVGDAKPGQPVQLTLSQLMSGQDDTPDQQVSETCQLVWGQPRCGAIGETECLYTYASCQSPARFVGIQTAFETNNPATAAALVVTPVNRNRSW